MNEHFAGKRLAELMASEAYLRALIESPRALRRHNEELRERTMNARVRYGWARACCQVTNRYDYWSFELWPNEFRRSVRNNLYGSPQRPSRAMVGGRAINPNLQIEISTFGPPSSPTNMRIEGIIERAFTASGYDMSVRRGVREQGDEGIAATIDVTIDDTAPRRMKIVKSVAKARSQDEMTFTFKVDLHAPDPSGREVVQTLLDCAPDYNFVDSCCRRASVAWPTNRSLVCIAVLPLDRDNFATSDMCDDLIAKYKTVQFQLFPNTYAQHASNVFEQVDAVDMAETGKLLVSSDCWLADFNERPVDDELFYLAKLAIFADRPLLLLHQNERWVLTGVDAASGTARFARQSVDQLNIFLRMQWEAGARDARANFDALPGERGVFDKVLAPYLPRRHDISMSVIILIHNNRDIIERLVRSALTYLPMTGFKFEIIVVDNASKDGGGDFVEQTFPEVTLLRNPRNGCSSGRNLGVAKATGDIIAFMDSDMEFLSSRPFREAVWLLEQNPKVGAVGWVGGWFDTRVPELAATSTEDLPRYGMTGEYEQLGFRSDVGYLGTGGMFVRRPALTTGVSFDERLDPTCFEDTDYGLQIRRAGYALAYRRFADILHDEHRTTRPDEDQKRYMQLFLRNANILRGKYRKDRWIFSEKPVDLPDLRFIVRP